MVSEVLKEEIRLTYEKLRLAIVILIFWLILTILDFTDIIQLGTGEEIYYFLTYTILATAAILFLILAVGIQAEPLVKQIIKNRKEIDKFWESEEELKPDLSKRTKASEVVIIFGIVLMLVALLFVIV